MQADPENRPTKDTLATSPGRLRIGAAVVVAVGLLLWYMTAGEPEPVAPQPEPVAVVQAAPSPTPDIPQPAPQPETPAAEPLPAEPPASLETSDEELRQRLDPAEDAQLLQSTLSADNLIERVTAAVDNLSRGIVIYKLLPVAPPKGKFAVTGSEDQLTIDPVSYRRYDDYARQIESMDTRQLVATFHRFRPLLETAYAGLGYEAADFDNALIRALDNIIDTPRLDGPIAVRKSAANYKFVDPELERKTALQKQLLRMGPDNTVRLQTQARALRQALLAQ